MPMEPFNRVPGHISPSHPHSYSRHCRHPIPVNGTFTGPNTSVLFRANSQTAQIQFIGSPHELYLHSESSHLSLLQRRHLGPGRPASTLVPP